MQALAGARRVLSSYDGSSMGVLVSPASGSHSEAADREQALARDATVGGRNRCTSRDPWEGDVSASVTVRAGIQSSVLGVAAAECTMRSLRVGPPASPGWAGRSVDRRVCESVSLSERGPTPRGARRPRSGEQAHARACSVRRHCARALLQRRALSWDTGLGDRGGFKVCESSRVHAHMCTCACTSFSYSYSAKLALAGTGTGLARSRDRDRDIDISRSS